MEATTIEAIDIKVISPLPNLERRYVSFVLNLFTKRSTLGVTVVAATVIANYNRCSYLGLVSSN